jgi:hypothetical protein
MWKLKTVDLIVVRTRMVASRGWGEQGRGMGKG